MNVLGNPLFPPYKFSTYPFLTRTARIKYIFIKKLVMTKKGTL